MKTLRSSALLLVLFFTPAFAGTVTFLASPGAAIDSISWASLGGDQTLFSDGATAVSVLSNQVTIGLGTQPALGGLTSVVCAVSPVNCSWGNQPSGYNDGDTLIWAEGLDANSNPVGTGPVSLILQNGVDGLGAFLQSNSQGAFSATLDVYHGNILLGTQSYSSNDNGDPLFVGALDDTAGEITRSVLSVTACGSMGCDANDFSVDSLQIYASTASATPEPSTFVLGSGLLVFGLSIRSRFGKGRK
jgi:hypothetical protein